MKQLVLLVFILIPAGAATAQDKTAQANTAPSCDKLPYRLGHIVILHSTDLRPAPRRINKKESKEMEKRQSELRVKCNTFVRKSPSRPVSTEFSYEVTGFAAYLVRCESFCGAEADLLRQGQKEIDETPSPNK
jgi:hypothetical protein